MYDRRIPPRGGWGLVEPTSRVLRGGSWNNDNPDNFRCANRNNNHPDNRNHNNGFRLARTVECQSPVLYGVQERVVRVQTGSRPTRQSLVVVSVGGDGGGECGRPNIEAARGRLVASRRTSPRAFDHRASRNGAKPQRLWQSDLTWRLGVFA